MFIVYPGNEKHLKMPLNYLYLINCNKKVIKTTYIFSAQFGGINPSLYLNPEDETKEVCAKYQYYDKLGYYLV